MPAAIDTDLIGDFAVATYYDDTAVNPQDEWDHAAVFVPFTRPSSWQRSRLADVVPATYVGADKLTHELANLDPYKWANYDDPDNFADWCAELTAVFGPDAHVAFVAYDDFGANGCRVTVAADPLPLADLAATWDAIVDSDTSAYADGCIVVSPCTAPDTDADTYAAIVRGDCDELTAYLSGEIYYWTVTDTTTGDLVDSVGGYYDYPDMLAEARATAAWHADQRAATLAWLRAEAETQLDVPDVTTALAALRTLDQLDELAAFDPT